MKDRIIIDSSIQHGKPVIKGTRVPISRVLAELANGSSHKDVIDDYGICEEDVRAVLVFTAELIEQDEFHPLPSTKAA